MKILPTLEGGLCITPESKADWLELSLISRDIGRPAHLAESLADLMDDDSEWEEYVVPDLKDQFNRQSRYVASVIEKARENKASSVFITPPQAEIWYGAINQARLALEARYKLNRLDEELEAIPSEVRSAYFRNRFYLYLQSILLEHVISP